MQLPHEILQIAVGIHNQMLKILSFLLFYFYFFFFPSDLSLTEAHVLGTDV